MIISRAPLRISFAGGGSDLPAYFMQSSEPGVVVSAAIEQYVYVILNKKFDDGVCIKYSKTENVRNVSEIKHDIIREALKHFGISKGIEIATVADVPGKGTGLGSSSALAVAIISALAKYTSSYYTRYDCAKLACDIEINLCKHPIGYQDQFASAFGGLNTIEFRKREVRVDEIKPMCGFGLLEDNLLMLWVGARKETADEILQEQSKNLSDKTQVFDNTKNMVSLAKEMAQDLWSNDIDNFGKNLNKGWEIKKSLSSKISNSKIDDLFSRAIDAGAIGGKLLGAGGGGFMLLFVSKDRKECVKRALSLKELPIKIDTQGVRIVEQR